MSHTGPFQDPQHAGWERLACLTEPMTAGEEITGDYPAGGRRPRLGAHVCQITINYSEQEEGKGEEKGGLDKRLICTCRVFEMRVGGRWFCSRRRPAAALFVGGSVRATGALLPAPLRLQGLQLAGVLVAFVVGLCLGLTLGHSAQTHEKRRRKRRRRRRHDVV